MRIAAVLFLMALFAGYAYGGVLVYQRCTLDIWWMFAWVVFYVFPFVVYSLSILGGLVKVALLIIFKGR